MVITVIKKDGSTPEIHIKCTTQQDVACIFTGFMACLAHFNKNTYHTITGVARICPPGLEDKLKPVFEAVGCGCKDCKAIAVNSVNIMKAQAECKDMPKF